MIRTFALAAVSLFAYANLSACTPESSSPQPLSEVRQLLGQKLMLDFRYFCDDSTPSDDCKQAVTELPPELAEVLRSGAIGGVIVFAENLETASQIMSLIDAMQQVMREHGLPPLFIALDQEGGRVARLPDDIVTRFSGNMAIGATYPNHGTLFANQVGAGIGKAVKLLGFNLNFAPTVDVNVNPENPVINVRSYGENAELVADLGQATVSAMQAQGVMSALKHFPGHGDTHVDSHTGLPRVDHDRATIDAVDLLPFKRSIASDTPPAMIMTAHIQYPQLDDTTFVATDGEATVVPATMSHKILTGVLRGQLGYHGVIVTDALDMAGIAHYFDPLAATVQTFQAGADIALMPYTIRNHDDIADFSQYFAGLERAVEDGAIDFVQLQASAARIAALKTKYGLKSTGNMPLAERIANVQARLPLAANKKLERELAAAAITNVFDNGVLPVTTTKWQLVMPDTLRCIAFRQALVTQQPTSEVNCVSLNELPEGQPWQQWNPDATLVIGDITPHHSLAEMGGMNDLKNWRERPSKDAQYLWIEQALTAAKQRQQPSVVIALRAPYVLSRFTGLADAALASYDYSAYAPTNAANSTAIHSPSIAAAVAALLGAPTPGVLPVTVFPPEAEPLQ
ncbi:glycoside hydrolase family 3 protein [Pseudidiomarina sp. E22-M8]|uniref:glycoside hydrolase family 3 protein n=1 Tax=Pseudidiomarina sp. E22-M8 TaxID=3424768 RepID=UPI00403CEFFF